MNVIIVLIVLAGLVFTFKKLSDKKKKEKSKPIPTPIPIPTPVPPTPEPEPVSEPEPEPPEVEPEPIPDPDPPVIEPEPVPEPEPEIDPLALIEWEGDTEYCKLEMWLQFKRLHDNKYLVKITQDVIKIASKIVYDEYGLVTILVDLSSNNEVNVDPVTKNGDNGHPGLTHSIGNGADIHYHGWPIHWNVKATLRWLEIVKECLPDFKIFVGPNVKTELEKVSKKRTLDWVIPDSDYSFGNAHEYTTEESSHYHCYLMRPWLREFLNPDYDAINKYKNKV